MPSPTPTNPTPAWAQAQKWELDLAERVAEWFRARYPEVTSVDLDVSAEDPACFQAEVVAEEHGGTMFSSGPQDTYTRALLELFLDIPSPTPAAFPLEAAIDLNNYDGSSDEAWSPPKVESNLDRIQHLLSLIDAARMLLEIALSGVTDLERLFNEPSPDRAYLEQSLELTRQTHAAFKESTGL